MAPAFLLVNVFSLIPDESLDVTGIIAKANENIGMALILFSSGGFTDFPPLTILLPLLSSDQGIVHGDIAIPRTRNADPCTAKGCKWPKSQNYVFVPVIISSRYSKLLRWV